MGILARPTLYLISGMVGAGKTTLATRLQAVTGAVRLSPDEGIKAFAQNPADRNEVDRLRDGIEALQWRVAQRLLSQGMDVILENGFWRRRERLDLLRAAHQLGADVILYFTDAPVDTLVDRVLARNQSTANTSFQVSEQEVRYWYDRLERPNAIERVAFDQFHADRRY